MSLAVLFMQLAETPPNLSETHLLLRQQCALRQMVLIDEGC